MKSKRSFRGMAMSVLVALLALLIVGTASLAWRNATVTKLYGLEIEQTIVSVTNKLGLVRRTVAFEPDTSRFERTKSAFRYASKNFPWFIIHVYEHFPSLHWRLGVGAKPLQLDAHEMEWSSGGSSGGYLYAIEPGVANSKWEFVHWTGMNIDELTPDTVRQSFGTGPKELETSTIAAGQIVFARLSTQPETIYVLKIQASYLNRAIVDYISIPSRAQWALGSSTGRDAQVCHENLRRLGLYAALYSEEHDGLLPSNFAQLSSASREPLGLVCPGKLPVGCEVDLGSFEEESGYIILSPGLDRQNPTDVGKVFAGCIKHGYVCLGDGSIQTCRRFQDAFLDEFETLLKLQRLTNSPAKWTD